MPTMLTAPPKQYPATYLGVLAALTDLGSTGAQVAGTLAAGGHVGRPASATSCPVAKYLCAVVSGLGPDDIAVSVEDLGFRGPQHRHPVNVDLPDPVVQFVIAFDGGAYPDLAYWRGGYDADLCDDI